MLRWMRFVGRDVSRYEVDGMDPVSLVSKPGRVDAGAATDDEDLAGRFGKEAMQDLFGAHSSS